MASVGLGLACLGCLWLSLSLRRHYRQVFQDDAGYLRWRRPLRLAGYGCALLALWPCARAFGLPIGLALWVAVLALAAFAQIMLLTYRPRALAAFGGLALLLLGAGLWP